jgi:cyanophycinase
VRSADYHLPSLLTVTRIALKSLAPWLALLAVWTAAEPHSYKYFRIGNPDDRQTQPAAGIAMMGGGTDLDEAFQWLCEKGHGGDFLILRAGGDDAYNPYVQGLCKANSVATLIIPDRLAAENPAVVDMIRKAEVLFIAGGDQANYVRAWKGAATEKAINEDIARGVPIGGTSAGLAVEGEFVYGSLNDKPDDKDLASTDVLPNPFFARVTVVRDFLRVPHLEHLITDSHFVKRDRMGRSLGFLARIMKDGWSDTPREVAIDEKSAVLVDSDGKARVVGSGKGAYFLRPTVKPEVCENGEPLTFRGIDVYRVPSGGRFDLNTWTGDGGTRYSLSVVKGQIGSSQPRGEIY